MTSPTETERTEIINATGKELHQWFTELDQQGFQCIHWKKQVKTLAEHYQLDLEWAEYIAEAYCSECGLPWQDQVQLGYQVLITRTFHYPLEHVRAFTRDWFEQEQRAIAKERSADHSSYNYLWTTDDSTVAVKLVRQGVSKTRLIVQHQEIESVTDAEIMRNFWKAHVRSMVETL